MDAVETARLLLYTFGGICVGAGWAALVICQEKTAPYVIAAGGGIVALGVIIV